MIQLQQQTFQSVASTIRQGFALPKPELSKFDGNPLEFWNFIRSFENNIEKNASDESEKLSFCQIEMELQPAAPFRSGPLVLSCRDDTEEIKQRYKKTNLNESNDTDSKSMTLTVSLKGNFHEKTIEGRPKRSRYCRTISSRGELG